MHAELVQRPDHPRHGALLKHRIVVPVISLAVQLPQREVIARVALLELPTSEVVPNVGLQHDIFTGHGCAARAHQLAQVAAVHTGAKKVRAPGMVCMVRMVRMVCMVCMVCVVCMVCMVCMVCVV